MKDSEAWAKAIIVVDHLRHGSDEPISIEDEGLLILHMTRNIIPCGGPVEHFSSMTPVVPSGPQADIQSVFHVYGSYDPHSRSIEIYINRIRQDAPTLRCNINELVEIVRLHEYAHAVLHLGLAIWDIEPVLSSYGSGNKTDWTAFHAQRLAAYSAIDSHSHEFLTQMITWACLTQLRDKTKSQRLRAVFDFLEAKQPLHYKLPVSLKSLASHANWRLVLDAVRGSISVYIDPNFSLKSGLEELVKQTAK